MHIKHNSTNNNRLKQTATKETHIKYNLTNNILTQNKQEAHIRHNSSNSNVRKHKKQ